jgi:hypothetical protein
METAIEEELNQNARLSSFQVFNRMLVSPGQFFGEDLSLITFTQALGFLILSSLFFSLAELSLLGHPFLIMSAIHFLNALVMPLLSAIIGYALIKKGLRKAIEFKKLLMIYALSSGLTLLMAWIPLFLWITEPWKWFLIGLGMVKGCELSRRQALFVITLSILLIILGFRSINEVLLLFR